LLGYIHLYSLVLACANRNRSGLNCAWQRGELRLFRAGAPSGQAGEFQRIRLRQATDKLARSCNGATQQAATRELEQEQTEGTEKGEFAENARSLQIAPQKGYGFCLHPFSFSPRPLSPRRLSKNRRVSAAHDPLYHVLVGLQAKVLMNEPQTTQNTKGIRGKCFRQFCFRGFLPRISQRGKPQPKR
jgi:hypothetical protein